MPADPVQRFKDATEEPSRYRLLGVNGDHDTCSLCGKTGLVRVAWLVQLDQDGNEDGEATPYGTDCAGRLLHGRKCAGNTKLVRDSGERLEMVRRWIRKGHSLEDVCKGWTNRTCHHAEPEAGGVRVWWGNESVLVEA